MNRQWIPGFFLLVFLAYGSKWASSLVEMGGKHPLEAAIIAILVGMALRAFSFVPTACEPGIKAFEKILILGIVCMGVSLDLELIQESGLSIFPIILGTMVAGFFSIYFLSRSAKLSANLSVLLALGTTICGGTAIAIASPVIRAKDEETSYAIGTIALWGLLGIISYPLIASALGVSDLVFGVFAGTAIHSTPQVVGAGYIFSDAAGTTATAVKLVRNCFIAPAVFLLAIWYSKQQHAETDSSYDPSKVFPWFLFGYFIMAGMRGMDYLTPEGIKAISSFGKFCILCGMAGIGLNTRISMFKSVGLTPLFIGGAGSALVALSSLGLIHIFL